jgi:hypothetical protein
MERIQGTSWYGVYFLGKQKCGYAQIDVQTIGNDPNNGYKVRLFMDVDVQMQLVRQKMITEQTRYYAPAGGLARIESVTKGAMGEAVVRGEVDGETLVVKSTMGGHTTTKQVPAPNESLNYVLAARRLIDRKKLGETIKFEVFEPSLMKSIHVTSKLLRFEERMLGGVKTRIGVVESTLKELGMKSTDYVTTDGELLESVVGGFFILRKEPENVARDVKAAFDAMRASIIKIKTPLGRPGKVKRLKLRLSGIRRDELLIDDARQKYERGEGKGGEGEGAQHVLTLTRDTAPTKPPARPVKTDDADVARWLRPSTFAQSDAPAVVKAARDIVGDTRDAWAAARKIQRWVYTSVDKKGMAALSNALDVLREKEGDCSEHSILFVALCRASGIPARQVVGIGYSPSMKGFGYHAWGEVYAGKWVAMDPTWGQDIADPTHVKFGVGDTESVGTIAGLFGSLEIKVLEVEK